MEKPLKRERSVNFTREETENLIALIGSKIHVLENKKSDAATWHEKEKVWKAIQLAFNKSTPEYFRDARHLKLKYESLKRDVRRKIKVSTDGSDTGDRLRKSLTPIEQKVKEMILSVEGKGDSDPLEITASTSDEPDSLELAEVILQPVKSEVSFSDNISEDNSNSITVEISVEPLPKKICLEQENVPILSSSKEIEQENVSEMPQKKLLDCPASLRFKKHSNLCKPRGKRPFHQLADAKLGNVMLQRQVLEEELKEKKLRKQMLKEEMERKKELHELEKEQMLLKIEILKTELENNCYRHFLSHDS